MTDSARQFDAQADRYAASEVHRAGASLPVLLEYAAPRPDDLALDVATGTGNTALALAPLVAEVTGVDLARKMLDHARLRAGAEGHAHARFVEGSAEALPYADRSFTLVTSRHAPHHSFWPRPGGSCAPAGGWCWPTRSAPTPRRAAG